MNDEQKGGKLALFEGGIEEGDILQGCMLGNCYFLATLASLAEKPNRIKNMFHEKELSSNGCYTIKCYKNGRYQEVKVDDYIPCLSLTTIEGK